MKIIVFVVTMIFASSSMAAQFATPSNTTYGEIVYIRSYGGADSPNQPTFIQVEGTPLRESCPHQNFGKGDLNYWLIYPEEQHLLSIALMAFASKIPVKITSNDSPDKMRDGACRVVYIDLKS